MTATHVTCIRLKLREDANPASGPSGSAHDVKFRGIREAAVVCNVDFMKNRIQKSKTLNRHAGNETPITRETKYRPCRFG